MAGRAVPLVTKLTLIGRRGSLLDSCRKSWKDAETRDWIRMLRSRVEWGRREGFAGAWGWGWGVRGASVSAS